MTGDRLSAPKADALPGCATPRPAEPRRFAGDSTQAQSDVRGNARQNTAGTGSATPGIVPDPLDACVCGDYRRDHKDGTGPCKFNARGWDLCHAGQDCLQFRTD